MTNVPAKGIPVNDTQAIDYIAGVRATYLPPLNSPSFFTNNR